MDTKEEIDAQVKHELHTAAMALTTALNLLLIRGYSASAIVVSDLNKMISSIEFREKSM